MITKKGSELEFISRIHRDGSGTTPVDVNDTDFLKNEEFCITCLSLTFGTYIASQFNVYVVKFKTQKQTNQ